MQSTAVRQVRGLLLLFSSSLLFISKAQEAKGLNPRERSRVSEGAQLAVPPCELRALLLLSAVLRAVLCYAALCYACCLQRLVRCRLLDASCAMC